MKYAAKMAAEVGDDGRAALRGRVARLRGQLDAVEAALAAREPAPL